MSTVLSAQAAAQGPAGSRRAEGLVAALRRWWLAYVTWRIERLAASRQSATGEVICRRRCWEA
jgi:hypothetical protein